MTRASDPAIVFDRVAKHYGRVEALRGVSLEVRRGEMFGVIGPDGAGKTTAIRLMCGLLHGDAGAIRVLGLDPVAQHRKLTASVGYLSQRFSLYGDLTVDENIAFFAEIHGVRDYGARRDRLLDLTQLIAFRRRLAGRLSGGMKQKLALACTLVHEPDLILLDEPTTGVDPVSRREFWKLLSEFLAHGITILMSTPYLDEAERCSRVALLHQGRCLALDTPDHLREGMPGQMAEIVVPRPGDVLARVRQIAGIEAAELFGDRLHVQLAGRTADAVVQLRAALSAGGVAAADVRPVPASLEDVFIAQLSAAAAAATGSLAAGAHDVARRDVPRT